MPHLKNKETWKQIKNYEGLYEVSSFGRIKSCKRKDALGRLRGGIILKPYTGNHGYKIVNLWLSGVQKSFLVHKLVAIGFLNHKPNGFEIDASRAYKNKLKEISNVGK